METIIIPLVLSLVISITSVIITTNILQNKFKSSILETLIENVSLTLNNEKMLSKAVKELYLDFVNNPQDYTLGHCTMNIKLEGISIWTANDIENRRFYTHDDKFKKSVKKLNSKVTQADRLLLDKMYRLMSDYKNTCDKRTDELIKIV